MTYEVELKFPLPDSDQLLDQLNDLGAFREEAIDQRDVYFAHPNRDFAETDEALRLRSVGNQNRITYKGPLIDQLSKTRREIEIPFAEGESTAGEFSELLISLGFQPVREVIKKRTLFQLDWEGRRLELAYDEVVGLGTFFEIETMAEKSGIESARDAILRFSQHLGLANSIRKSYLCLLLEQESQE